MRTYISKFLFWPFLLYLSIWCCVHLLTLTNIQWLCCLRLLEKSLTYIVRIVEVTRLNTVNKIQLARILSGTALIFIEYIIKKLRLLWLFSRIPWTVLIPILVLIPIFGYINCGKIWLVLNYCLRIVHTFMGSPNNVNCMDSGVLQHCASWLDSICVFIVLTALFHTFYPH